MTLNKSILKTGIIGRVNRIKYVAVHWIKWVKYKNIDISTSNLTKRPMCASANQEIRILCEAQEYNLLFLYVPECVILKNKSTIT